MEVVPWEFTWIYMISRIKLTLKVNPIGPFGWFGIFKFHLCSSHIVDDPSWHSTVQQLAQEEAQFRMLFLGASIAGEATKSAALMAYVSRPSKFTVHIKVVLCRSIIIMSCPALCAPKGTNYCHSLGFGAQVMSIHSTYFALLHFLGSLAGVISRNCQWNVKEFNMWYVFILGGVRGREHEHADSERLCMNMPTQWAVFRSHCEPILFGQSFQIYAGIYYVYVHLWHLTNDDLNVLLQT